MSVLPQEMSNLLENSMSYGGVLQSVETYTTASSLIVSQNNTIHVFLEGGDALDFRNSFVYFNTIGVAGTGGTYAAFQPCIASVFSRCRVLIGSTVVHDILNFGLVFTNYLMSQKVAAWTNTLNIQMSTSDSLATRTTNFASTTKAYTVDIGLLADFLKQVVPVMFLGQQIHIELTLADPLSALVSDQTGPSYSLSNIQFHYRKLTLSESYKNMLKQKITSGGLDLICSNLQNYSAIVQAGTAQIQNIIPFKYSRFTGLMCIARNVSDLSSQTVDAKNNNIYQNYSVFNRHRVKINNNYFPNDSVYGTVQCYQNLLEFFDIPDKEDTYIGVNWAASPGSFSLELSLSQNPITVAPKDEHKYLSGQEINMSSSNLVHECVTTGLVAQEQWDYYGSFFSIVRMNADGSVTYIE
jgi:hypothetical protein